MDPTQCAEVMLRALMKGDEDLVKSTMRYAKHMFEMSHDNKWETELDIFNHSLSCSLCFSFNMKTGAWMEIEKFWKASEEHNDTQHPWANDWIMIKN